VSSTDDPRLELSFSLHATDALEHGHHPSDRQRRLEEKVSTTQFKLLSLSYFLNLYELPWFAYILLFSLRLLFARVHCW
jgi:hypothetical protein